MDSWRPTTEHVTIKVKRAPRLVGLHQMVGGFLYGEDTPLKTDQLGAAGGEPRSGVWLPAAQGALYSDKGQGFLPGRTGLNPLKWNTLGDQGFRGEALLPPAGDGDYKGL